MEKCYGGLEAARTTASTALPRAPARQKGRQATPDFRAKGATCDKMSAASHGKLIA